MTTVMPIETNVALHQTMHLAQHELICAGYSAQHLRLGGRAQVGGGCADKCLCRDDDSMQAIYGRHVTTRSVLLGKVAAPATA